MKKKIYNLKIKLKIKNRIRLFAILFLLTIYNFPLTSIAQPNTVKTNIEICKHPKIEWIKEISSESISNSDKGFFESLLDFIIGKDELQILKPFNLVTDSEETIYFIDQDNKNILKYSSAENEIVLLLDDNIILKSPVGMCLSEKNLVITDSELNEIYIHNLDDEETSILNSSLEQPTGITYLKDVQEFWVCETKQHRIARLNKDGDLIGNIGIRGIDEGQFNFPTFMWTDGNGKIYINDSMNFRIQLFSSDGKFIRQFGKPGDGSGDLARPKGIATDSYNNIYVVDALFNNVQIFDQRGRLLYSFGERGTESEMFWIPTGIFIDKQNKIYIADSFNSRIQIFQLRCEN